MVDEKLVIFSDDEEASEKYITTVNWVGAVRETSALIRLMFEEKLNGGKEMK